MRNQSVSKFLLRIFFQKCLELPVWYPFIKLATMSLPSRAARGGGQYRVHTDNRVPVDSQQENQLSKDYIGGPHDLYAQLWQLGIVYRLN